MSDKKPATFGWCITNSHLSYIYEMTDYYCKCDCHKEDSNERE
nr:MAG TPA: hypothetical protein [Caudoviricetes sp.]